MYVQLYTKTVYSLLKSALKIEDYVEAAKLNDMRALAITDEKNAYGLVKFYKECVKQGIKPILGLSVNINVNIPLLFYAKTNRGYHHLLGISSKAQLNEKLVLNDLKPFAKDLICIVPTLGNPLFNLKQDDLNIFIGSLKKLFSDLYLSIHKENNEKAIIFNQNIAAYASAMQIPLIALQEVKYLKQEDSVTLRFLEAIDKGEKITPNTIQLFTSDHYFLDNASFNHNFIRYPDAIQNTIQLMDMCQVELDFKSYHLPKYPLKDDISSDDYLKLLCKKGLEKRLNTTNIPRVYLDRLKYELEVIHQMHYSDYFLIVYDFVKFAKKNNILVGPGRGSAAGSLVSYVLGITNIDPIEYDLLFERFLNPERISMPDIDLDFQDDRRDEVIHYVKQKYGVNHVAHIVTFGTFLSRSALREVAKVMNINNTRLNEVMSHIHSRLSIEENIKASESLQSMIKEYEEIHKLFSLAQKIEGIPRNTSTHAAGIIICEEDLQLLTGLQPSFDEVLQTQYEAKDLEDLGLLKIDFLGLRNLTAISEIIALIKRTQQIDIDLNAISLDDAKTYRLIARGETTGLFQLESNGMRSVLQDLKASTFEDIVATNALFRPGPMENIPSYIKRKHKEEKVTYLHPDLIPILEKTYGIIVYQEQVMLVAQKIANYSLAEADLLRRAMGKKQKDVLEKERIKFVQGALKNGYEEQTALTLFEYILKFADYGFNRSHSVAYALISYQMAYLKANFIVPFMVTLLSSVIGNDAQTHRYIMDCKRYGIKISGISINSSYNNYVIENTNTIRMSFLSIKGIGKSSCDALLNERASGPFKDLYDFINRTQAFMKQNIYQALVYAGAFDEFGHTKKALIENYDKVYDLIRFNPSGYFTNQLELNLNKEEYPVNDLMKKEKEVLGFYLSTHPIQKIALNNQILPSQTLKYINKQIEVVAYLESIRYLMTKNNEEMAQVTLSDDLITISGVIFPNDFRQIKQELEVHHIYAFQCKVQERYQKVQLIINKIKIIK